MRFSEALRQRIDGTNSLVCCGLDPDRRKMPSIFDRAQSDEQAILEFITTVIDITAAHVCAYKIQKAFFDLHAGGKILLKQIVTYIRERTPNTPIIIDCKIGDIDNTMEAYLQALLGDLDADGVVLNPYMGVDVWSSLKAYPDKAGVVLIRTSNPGSDVIQEVQLSGGRPLWRYVLDLIVDEWRKGATLIPILSSNSMDDFIGMRSVIPDDLPIFLAGVGAQGGQVSGVKYLVDSQGRGLMINSSRALLYPYEVDDSQWERAVQLAVINMKEAINKHRR